jgi:hypothetical protein
MDDRALMQMALDAFEAMISEGWSYCGRERTSKAQTAFYEATLALRERLAQSEPEAVAWMKVWIDGTKNFYDHEPPMFGKHETYPLYISPSTRQENRQVAKNATTDNQEVAKSATTDWEAVAADQAMTIAMMKMEQKRDWICLDPEMMRNTSLEFNRGALWAERYLKEKNG